MTQVPSRSMEALVLCNLHLFDYDRQNKRGRWEGRAPVRRRHVITWVEKILVMDIKETKKVRVASLLPMKCASCASTDQGAGTKFW